MIDTARLIITMDCNRDCVGCCNKSTAIIEQVTTIQNLALLRDYPIIVITGGEPMLNWERTLKIAIRLKHNNPNVILYLYSSWYNHGLLLDMIDLVDGLHYTLHYPTKESDIQDFNNLQGQLCCFNDKSFRLFIDNRVYYGVYIMPNLWHRVEIKPWMKECPLPSNEKLFILKRN